MINHSMPLVDNQSIELFSLPENLVQLRLMLNDSRYTGKDYGHIIRKDPAMALRLLKIANNAHFGAQSRVDTISRAISIVGTDALQNLVLSTSVAECFENIPGHLMDMNNFWMRSAHGAVISEILAKKCNVLHSERFFVTGLLHNIGSLILYFQYPKESIVVLKESGNGRQRVIELEKQLLGFSHVDIAVELIQHWGLPRSISETIRHSLNPIAVNNYSLDASILNLAMLINDVVMGMDQINDLFSDSVAESLSLLNIDENEIEQIINQSRKVFFQTYNQPALNSSST